MGYKAILLLSAVFTGKCTAPDPLVYGEANRGSETATGMITKTHLTIANLAGVTVSYQ